MGCTCARVAPVTEPIPVKIREANQTNQETKRESIDSERERSKTTRLPAINDKNAQNTDHHEQLVNDIEAADPYALNTSFIQQRQKAIDNHSYRSTIQSWRPNSLQQLVNAIKSLSESKSIVDCHWIIFYWITYNIEYDTVSYFSKNYADQTAEGVFRTRKGVCAGYGNIYKYLCDALNIPCEKVSGYSKGYGFDEREGAPTETDHAWNAVEIDHRWYLIESTWGAGYLTEEKNFQRELDSYYFLPNPTEMIYHHLPEIEKWQLLKKPIKMKQYLQMPKLQPLYFELNLDLISPRNQAHVHFAPGKAYALVLIQGPSDVDLIANLKLNNKKIEGGDRVEFDTKKQMHCCYFAPNTIGKHKITIYAKKKDAEGKYHDVIHLTLDVSEMPKNPISFPETWKNFFDLNMEVVSPKDTHLIKVHNRQTDAEILIRTPDDVELLGSLTNTREEKVEGGHQVFYDRHKSLWRCKFAPNCDGMFDAQIFAKRKADKGEYTSAVKFKIDAKNILTPPMSYPNTWPLFYELGLKIEAPRNRATAVWPDNASFAEIRISAPNDVALSCGIEFNGIKNENCALTQFDHDKQQWQLLFAPQRTGLHQLMIYGRRQSGANETSHSVAKFDLHVTRLRKPMKFPSIYGKFQTTKCRIYEPLEGTLKKGLIVPFHCVIPGATEVKLQVDSKWVGVKGYEDPILKTDITVGSKDVTVYVKYGQNTNYDGLIRYSVE
ncbi:unnamed protein product [Rotaria magnacalcarata]|uniref:Transglutaminase-like domain-containing protein n=1 Tax=Rotaria magnacalcarata TaxID=392030 RepID=A0A816R884_9BILA|nr:unnamed protein product [Rotaria magnacalcarata]CAF3926606.1 unnamed protein product [Rotaria magnacalcarata]